MYIPLTMCHRFTMIYSIATIYLILLIDFVHGDDDGSSDKACPMEMRFHTSFDTCYDSSTIATATIYVDGQCHTVETNLSPSDDNYSILPGNYRVECSSDGTLKFLDSACQEGTCSASATCNADDSLPGSLFARVPGQLVQDTSVGDNYICETLFDDDYEIFFVIFGDCSLPGCSVDGSINPTPSAPTAPTPPEPSSAPVAEPQPQTQPTRRPISPTNPPQTTTTPVPVATPSTTAPQSTAPIVNVPPPTLAPVTSSPVEIPSVPVNVTAAPIPTASPILESTPTISPSQLPSQSPMLTPLEPTTPTASPVEQGDPTKAPNKNVRTPSPMSPPTPSPTKSVTQSSSSDSNNSVVILGAIGGVVTVIVMFIIWWCVGKQCRQCKSVNSKNTALATTASSEKKKKELQLGHDVQNHDRLLATTATNEIWFDPSRDDVSTLDGGTLPEMAVGTGGDEPTASVNMDFDYNKNRFRSSATVDERSRFTASTNPTAVTSLSKLGLRSATSSVFDRNNDEQSFDQQFADMDDEEIMTAVGSMNWSRTGGSNDRNANAAAMNDIANRVRPFEVVAPPGMLGLVIDSPNGSVPLIRAIKPTSVLYPQVQVGDRLISVDHQNVTSMSATEVSNLITQKQHLNRVFVLCRLVSESQQHS